MPKCHYALALPNEPYRKQRFHQWDASIELENDPLWSEGQAVSPRYRIGRIETPYNIAVTNDHVGVTAHYSQRTLRVLPGVLQSLKQLLHPKGVVSFASGVKIVDYNFCAMD
jgi:hypothetical protein